MNEELKSMLSQISASLQNVMSMLGGGEEAPADDSPEMSPDEMMEKAKEMEEKALGKMKKAEDNEDDEEMKRIAEEAQKQATKAMAVATKAKETGKAMKAIEFEEAINAEDGAEERAEDTLDNQSEEALNMVKKSVEALNQAIDQKTKAQKSLEQKTQDTKMNEVIGVLQKIGKSLEAFGQRMAVTEEALENIMDATGITEAVQKSMEAGKEETQKVEKSKPVTGNPDDFRTLMENLGFQKAEKDKETKVFKSQAEHARSLSHQAAEAMKKARETQRV